MSVLNELKMVIKSVMRKKTWPVILILLITICVIGSGFVVRNYLGLQLGNSINAVKSKPSASGTPSVRQENTFINEIATPAIKLYRRNRQVLPSVVIAQACLESNFGTSQLYRDANNIFGVKGTYYGQSVSFSTREVEGGRSVMVMAQFRKYPNVNAAMIDHNRLVTNKFITKKNIMSYRQSASMLQENGYATDPGYAKKLERIIVKYHLSSFDLKAIND